MTVNKTYKDTLLIVDCPACGAGTINIDTTAQHQYGYCSVCDAAYINYEPLPHQKDVHNSKSKVKLLLGGMGSAKTNCGVMEIIRHALSTPNGNTLLLAQTLKQLSSAILPVFDTYLPRKFVQKWTDTKTEIKIVLTNGHILEGFASDDEEKFRSKNITAFYIEEASGIKPSIYKECLRRLRNKHGIVNGHPHYVGVVASNPAQGFIRDLLFTASHIYGSESIKSTVAMYKDRIKNPNPDLSAFLSSSRDNPYLPEGFIQSVMNSLTPQEQRLYIDCIIEYAEGAVYPDILTMLVDDFKIPDDWERWVAHDPGVRDPAAILLAAVDPNTKTVYFYREFYKTDQVIAQVAQNFKLMTTDIPQGLLRTPLIDPSANKRNQIDGRTYKMQMQVEYGIVFKEANNAIEPGIQKVKNMMYFNKIKFFRSLTNTIWEGCEYRYPTAKERGDRHNLGDIPVDKNNHLMDCMRYIIQALPYDYTSPSKFIDNSYLRFQDEEFNKESEQDIKSLLTQIAKSRAMEKPTNNKKYRGGYVL